MTDVGESPSDLHDVVKAPIASLTLHATTSELMLTASLSCSAAQFRVPLTIAHVLIR
jgi:hypothetical protein